VNEDPTDGEESGAREIGAHNNEIEAPKVYDRTGQVGTNQEKEIPGV